MLKVCSWSFGVLGVVCKVLDLEHKKMILLDLELDVLGIYDEMIKFKILLYVFIDALA